VSARDVRSLLRDSASILRIRYHDGGTAVDSAREEFVRFMTDALPMLESDGPLFLPRDVEPRRSPRRSWLLNPLDGEAAFRGGFPCFAVVLGLRERNRMTAGFVYNPVTEDMFWSDADADGAYYGDIRVRVRTPASLPFGLRGTCEVSARCSLALSLVSVAAGRCDYATVHGCDWVTEAVAGYIVERAGGKVRSCDNGEVHALAGRRVRPSGGHRG
jgi:myo-inositol-1(or 4)-monophosphatase